MSDRYLYAGPSTSEGELPPNELRIDVPPALQALFAELRDNPEEADRKSAEHAAKMGVNPEAFMRKWGLQYISATIEPTPVPLQEANADVHENETRPGAKSKPKSQHKVISNEIPSVLDLDNVVPTYEVMDTSASLFVDQVEKYPILDLPDWYQRIKPTGFNVKQIKLKRPQSLASLNRLKETIVLCEKHAEPGKPINAQLAKAYDSLRDLVHQAEFLAGVDQYVVWASKILTVNNGLPRVFGEEARFPWDLKADAYQLYLRWIRGDFQQDVLRGITTKRGLNRISDRLDPIYKAKYPTNVKCYGHNGLVVGQCWPTQLCTVRDGAHGSSQGGIFGEKDKGAYSVVVSGGGGYHDKDDGDVIIYSGTKGKDFKATEATQQMITSHDLANEIRVLRSHQLPSKNKYRPSVGLRYDGLYKVTKIEIVDEEKQDYLFTLKRIPGQNRIRYGNDAASRPTRFEIAEYKKLKE
ncbi:hypothetical protein ACEQ8H_001747 [Pleosporales sp. CAS-2024a]